MSDVKGDDIDSRGRRAVMSPALKITVGTVAVLAWGLIFDQLTRVAGWILDTYNVLVMPPLIDLHSRYRDASIIIHKGHLYGLRHGASTSPPITAYPCAPFPLI